MIITNDKEIERLKMTLEYCMFLMTDRQVDELEQYMIMKESLEVGE